LKGKQSPWKDRVAGRWQRRLVTTDSSAEQSLEVGCFVRYRRAPTPAHFGGCRRSATEAPRLRLRVLGGCLRAAGRSPSRATRGSEANSAGGPIVPGRVGAPAPAPSGRFHAITSGASASGGVVCSMTWGSASADRSIIASTPLPRTPVPPPERAGTPGHPGAGQSALLLASRARSLAPSRRSSEHRAVPPGTSPGLFGGQVGSTGVRRTELFGAPRATPRRRTTTSTPRGVERCLPGLVPAALRSHGPHPTGARQRSSSEPRVPRSNPGS